MSDPYNDHPNIAPGAASVWASFGGTVGWLAQALLGGGAGSSASITQSTQAGATYTLALADAGTVVRMTNASNPTVTVPPNSSVALPVGSLVNVYVNGATGATLAPGAGVTILNNSPSAIPQFGEVSLRQDSIDTWVRL